MPVLVYNIARLNPGDEDIMLGVDVHSISDARKWLETYRTKYGPGNPFPNGKGYYDGLYCICVHELGSNCYKLLH